MHTVVVRVWLPDRPGALGQVASRIGSVRGDVLGIDILEVGAGRVIDELVVALPDAGVVDLMVSEVHAIDGVSVEHVRPTVADRADAAELALTLAAELAETPAGQRPDKIVEGVAKMTDAAWVLLADGAGVLAVFGDAPAADYVASLVAGSRHLGEGGAGDLFWADLPGARMWLAAGRPERPVHDRERTRLHLFARIADVLLGDRVGETV